MSFLAKIQAGKQATIPRILVLGAPAVGKSTFAAGAPDVLFLDIEGRTNHLDVRRVSPKNYDDVKEAVIEVGKAAKTGKPICKWLVVDTVDHLGLMINDAVCAKEKWENIETPGYGRGYNVALETWREFLQLVDGLRGLGVGVILLGHSGVKNFQNPAGADYSTWGLALDKRAAKFVADKMDLIGHASFEDDVSAKFDRKGEQVTKGKASTTGRRILYFGYNPAMESKKGLDMPDEIELSWAAFSAALNPTTTEK